MQDQFTLAETAAQRILQRSSLRPRIGLVLGSGLGAFADSLADSARIPFSEIPAFPRSTAIGHAGQLVIGKAGSGAPTKLIPVDPELPRWTAFELAGHFDISIGLTRMLVDGSDASQPGRDRT